MHRMYLEQVVLLSGYNLLKCLKRHPIISKINAHEKVLYQYAYHFRS